MTPNVYVAYLCLTENNSYIRKSFVNWRREYIKGAFNSARYSGALSGFKQAVRSFKWQMEHKARMSFIYEAEQEWAAFSATSFIKFLEQHGFKI